MKIQSTNYIKKLTISKANFKHLENDIKKAIDIIGTKKQVEDFYILWEKVIIKKKYFRF